MIFSSSNRSQVLFCAAIFCYSSLLKGKVAPGSPLITWFLEKQQCKQKTVLLENRVSGGLPVVQTRFL